VRHRLKNINQYFMNDITPIQRTGKAIDARSSRELESIAAAKVFFATVREKLRDIPQWSAISGKLLASFQLVDSNGREIVDRAPVEGDYLKIDIPGPGTGAGDGFDWVRIEAIESTENEDMEEYGFRVRPAHNPTKGDGETAHFYSADATSSFVVRRAGPTVSAEVHDRNTKTNEEADNPVDMLRNKVAGIAGLMAFSKVQWQSLTDGLIAN
jgi:hypothetical protein